MMEATTKEALIKLGRFLKSQNYHFVSPTPETHRRVLAKQRPLAGSLRDIFGWNKDFAKEALDQSLFEELLSKKVIRALSSSRFQSYFRASTLEGMLFFHSAFPTNDENSVFFGPDTYRFVRFLKYQLPNRDYQHVVDLGCGSGAGALSIISRCKQLSFVDINPVALDLAEINAQTNLQASSKEIFSRCHFLQSDLFEKLSGDIDLIIANPPFMVDDQKRAYRDGGGNLGMELSLRIVEEGLQALRRGGILALYTASPICQGKDLLWETLQKSLKNHISNVFYEEIDPDIFGEEIEKDSYAEVERIAAVGLILAKS